MVADGTQNPDVKAGEQTAADIDRAHEEFLTHLERLRAGERHYARSYDKWLLTLSGGALGLSMTLCKDVIRGTGQNAGWLLLSWFLFAAAILSILSCKLLSQGAHGNDAAILDELYREQGDGWRARVDQEQKKQWRRKAIGWINRASLVSFASGLGFLAYFAYLNIGR